MGGEALLVGMMRVSEPRMPGSLPGLFTDFTCAWGLAGGRIGLVTLAAAMYLSFQALTQSLMLSSILANIRC